MTTRHDITLQARKYLKTPFQHEARVRGVGVDCVGLVLCVGEELGLTDKHGELFNRHKFPYYNAIPSGSQVLKELRKHMTEKNFSDMKEGDVVCMTTPLEPSHTGIISLHNGKFYLIHAYNSGQKQCVIEHIIDIKWRRRMVALFEYSGVE